MSSFTKNNKKITIKHKYQIITYIKYMLLKSIDFRGDVEFFFSYLGD
jgi:hypothetical protein